MGRARAGPFPDAPRDRRSTTWGEEDSCCGPVFLRATGPETRNGPIRNNPVSTSTPRARRLSLDDDGAEDRAKAAHPMILLALLDSLAITGGTVLTMVPGERPVVATVLIEDDHVVAVGPKVEIPAAARRYDASGKFVIPGLIDAFVNHDPDHDRLY